MEIAGGTYALLRSSPVSVSVAGRAGVVHRPDLAGAILIKAVAAARDTRRGPERHLRDLAFLLSLVADPIAVREELGAANRARVRSVEELRDPRHEAWGLLGDDAMAADAHAALRLISVA